MVDKIHFSSESPEWGTPQDLFDKLNHIFNFDLDVCATHENAKCTNYITQEQCGLATEWKGKCFMNPPYGRTMSKWIEKAKNHNDLVVCILPARTDTKYWQDLVMKADVVKFIRGRLKFTGANAGSGAAPFPSAIVIFNLFKG